MVTAEYNWQFLAEKQLINNAVADQAELVGQGALRLTVRFQYFINSHRFVFDNLDMHLCHRLFELSYLLNFRSTIRIGLPLLLHLRKRRLDRLSLIHGVLLGLKADEQGP